MKNALVVALTLVLATAAVAAPSVEPVECLPNEANQVVWANGVDVPGGGSARLYFRRLNPTGASYFVDMVPAGDGSYWGVFPEPEWREQQDLTDEWWEVLQDRDWIADRERDEIAAWMDGLEHEAAEYHVSVIDDAGSRVSRSQHQVVEVWEHDECEHELTPVEAGYASNLTVGETTEAQIGRPVYHWLCWGIVTRLGNNGILRGDEICRACVVGAWLPASSAAGALIMGTAVTKREPKSASDTQP